MGVLMRAAGRANGSIPISVSRAFHVGRVSAWIAGIWAAYLFGLGPYVYLRSLGARSFAPSDGRSIEQHLFRFVPTEYLQNHLYGAHSLWLDYAGFLVHLSWFTLPFACGAL